MGLGNLKGRVVIENAGSAALQQVKRDLDGIANASKRINLSGLNTFAANATASLRHQLDRMQRMTAPAAAATGGAGLAVKGIIDQTKDFNEAKYGYGFARLSDYIKNGKLDLQGWKAEIDATAKAVQAKAKEVGTLPAYVMKAREEVEKLGFKGSEAESIYEAALGLHLSEPGKLGTGQAAQYMGAVYRAFEKQSIVEREKIGARMGKTASDPEVIRSYIKGLAAKAAVAGAESALGPADVVEGMRQYAPQWAGLGISYDFALGALAHGANYGFRAPELGTAYKSMAMRLIKPTGEGMRWMNRLNIDRSQFMEMDVADPKRGVNQIHALLGNALGKNDKFWLEQELIKAQKGKYTTNPEFRGQIVTGLEKRLGKGFAGKRMDIETAFDDGVYAPTKFKDGGFDGLIRAIIASKAGPAAMGTIFEGRHIARNDPIFSFYEKMYALFEKIQGVDGGFMDAVVDGRKASEAGKTDAVKGSWENLMIQVEQSGGLIDKVKTSVTDLNQALASMPSGALTGLTAAVLAIGSVAGLATIAKMIPVGKVPVPPIAPPGSIPSAVPTVPPVVGAPTGPGKFSRAMNSPFLQGPLIGLGVWDTYSQASAGNTGAAVEGGIGTAAGGAAWAKHRGWLGRFGRFVPGMGYVMAGTAAWYGGKYLLGGSAKADEAGAGGAAIPSLQDAMAQLPAATAEIGTAASDVAAQVRTMMAEVHAGFQQGTAAVVEALQSAAANINAAGSMAGAGASGGGSGPLRVPLNTGPTMGGDN